MNGKARTNPSTGWIVFFAGFGLALLVGWVIFPQILYSSKAQPFAFSHAVHGEDGLAGLSCEACHYFNDDGSYQGIPDLESCFDCHTEIQGDSTAEKTFFIQGGRLLREGKSPRWFVYSKQPPCVYFSHAPHIRLAKLECIECHRDITHEDVPPPIKLNRITGYSKFVYDNLKMDDCAACHEKNGTSNACFVCHK